MSIHRLLILMAAWFSSAFVLGSWGWQEPVQAAQGKKGNESGESGGVTLRIAGDKGTRFSGVCSVGQEEHDISGRAPQSFEFEPNDRKLVCEVRKQGAQGTGLEIILEGENTRSVQRIAGGAVTVIKLVYERGKLTSLTSSTSSQKLSTAGDSASSTANGDAQGVDDQKSLADQIREKVDEILEQVLP